MLTFPDGKFRSSPGWTDADLECERAIARENSDKIGNSAKTGKAWRTLAALPAA